MRAVGVVLALLLAGCPVAERNWVQLVCTVDGQEVYRGRPEAWIKNFDGIWHSRGGSWKYQPSARESCRTEPVARGEA